MDFNAASQRLVRFSLQAQLSACSNHDFPYLKYFDTHRDSHVREGDDAGRVSPFATPIGDDCRANKGQKCGCSVKQCKQRGGGK